MALISPLTLIPLLILAAQGSAAPVELLVLLWLLPVIGSAIAAILIKLASGLLV
jgi:hypothetical protein